MVKTNMDESVIKRKLGETLELVCVSKALPKATVKWLRDDIELINGTNLFIENGNTVLTIPFIKPEDEGLYECVASNRLKTISRASQVKITS